MNMYQEYNQMIKQDEIESRVRNEAEWYLDERTSIRDVAENFCISKSTVYKDLSERLKYIDYDLYDEVRCLLHYNRVHAVEKMNKINAERRNRR